MFLGGEAGQEAPGIGSVQLDQILESTSTLASSVALLQVQLDRERQLPKQRTRPTAPLRRAPMQSHQAGKTGTRQQGSPTFPPALSQTFGSPDFTTAATQARFTPTFQPALTLAQVHHT